MTKPSDIQVVINPYAGIEKKSRKAALERLRSVAQACGQVIEEGSLEKLRDRLRQSLAEKPKVLAIYGGDGSIHHLLNILMELKKPGEWPLVLPLSGGTMNVLVTDVGAHGAGDKLLLRLHDKIAKGEDLPFIERGILRCEIKNHGGAGKTIFGLSFGAGLPFYGLQEFYTRKSTPWNAVRLIFDLMFRSEVRDRVASLREMKLTLDGELQSGSKWLGIFASTLQTSVLNLRPFWEKPKDITREFSVVACGMSMKELVYHFPLVFWSKGQKRVQNRAYYFRNTRAAELLCDGGFTLDGELFTLEKGDLIRIELCDTFRIPDMRAL